MSAPLVLASASPRRRELLAELGMAFEVVPSNVPEVPRPGESAQRFAARVAREKAVDVARRRPGCFVLAADTLVSVDGCILGKPTDRQDARRMLRLLSGRTHQVLTAVALVDPAGEVEEAQVQSEVEFRRLEADDLERYLDTGEAFDKAGAYAVQGLARAFVQRVRGSFSNVVGLPKEEVSELLHRHGAANVAPVP
jgi:septum formation protein